MRQMKTTFARVIQALLLLAMLQLAIASYVGSYFLEAIRKVLLA
jgi:hypothetical protein